MSLVRTPARLALVLLAATAFAACSNEDGVPGPSQFRLNVGQAITAQQGGSGSTGVSVTRADGYHSIIHLSVSGLPTGVTPVFSPDAIEDTSVLILTVGIGVAAGFYPLQVTAQSPGETHSVPLNFTVTVAPHFRLSLSSPTLSIAQGASAPLTVTIERFNFDESVQLRLTPRLLPAPTGVTASFSPANPEEGNSAVMTLTVASTASVGTFAVQVEGDDRGGSAHHAVNFDLVITPAVVAGNFTLSTTPPSPVSLVQGASAPVTVNINRSGGNASDVEVTATFTGTQPGGLTLTGLPASSTGTSAAFTIVTTAGTPVGTYPIVIHGNTPGLAEQTSNLTINVTAPPAPVNVTVSFASCSASNKAVWLAYMDGTSDTWTAVTGAADVYQFPIAQSKGSFAWVALPPGQAQTFVRHMTQAELGAGTIAACGAAVPAGKTVNVVVAGLGTGSEAQIDFAGANKFVTASGAFQLTNAMNGSFDLIGFARFTSNGVATRAFIARGENPAAGGSFSVPVDFAHVTRSAAAVAGAGTVTGLTGGETQLYNSMVYYTGGTACLENLLYASVGTPPSFNFYGIPASLRAAGDMHGLQLRVTDGSTSTRSLTEAFVDVAARAATPFLLPPPLPNPVATDAGGPYKRPSVAVTGIPVEYDVSHTLFWIDHGGSGEQGTVMATQGWVGGSTVTLALPNFHGVGSFNDAWAPAPADVLDWNFRSAGAATGCAAGQRAVAATRTGSL